MNSLLEKPTSISVFSLREEKILNTKAAVGN